MNQTYQSCPLHDGCFKYKYVLETNACLPSYPGSEVLLLHGAWGDDEAVALDCVGGGAFAVGDGAAPPDAAVAAAAQRPAAAVVVVAADPAAGAAASGPGQYQAARQREGAGSHFPTCLLFFIPHFSCF